MLAVFRKTFTLGRALVAVALGLLWFAGEKPRVADYIEEQRKWLAPQVLEAIQAYATSPIWVPLTLIVLLFGLPFAHAYWRQRRDLPPRVRPIRALWFPVAWEFPLFAGRPHAFQLDWVRTNGEFKYYVGCFVFTGINISTRSLYQFDAWVKGDRGERIQLSIAQGGKWVAMGEAESISPGARFQIGIILGGYRMPIETFLRDIGGFTLHFSCDGRSKKWRFSQRQLASQFEIQKREVPLTQRNMDLLR